jgi:septal ring factor EnvC (AmiA/AmiB activator)
MATDQHRRADGPLAPDEFEAFIQRARALTAAEARLGRLIQSIDDELARAEARRNSAQQDQPATPEADGGGKGPPARGRKSRALP